MDAKPRLFAHADRFHGACARDGHRVELFPSHHHTIDIEDEPIECEAPEFEIGGWTTPPDRWWNDASAFTAASR